MEERNFPFTDTSSLLLFIVSTSFKKLVLHNFVMKKQILQELIIKKETVNFCSAKQQTLQSLRGILYNCVLDTTKLYNRHYKTVYATNLGASMIQAPLQSPIFGYL